jgi:hypothetical protein
MQLDRNKKEKAIKELLNILGLLSIAELLGRRSGAA